jgi:hypothetical protein
MPAIGRTLLLTRNLPRHRALLLRLVIGIRRCDHQLPARGIKYGLLQVARHVRQAGERNREGDHIFGRFHRKPVFVH